MDANVRTDEITKIEVFDWGNTWAIPDQKPQHGAGVPHSSPCASSFRHSPFISKVTGLRRLQLSHLPSGGKILSAKLRPKVEKSASWRWLRFWEPLLFWCTCSFVLLPSHSGNQSVIYTFEVREEYFRGSKGSLPHLTCWKHPTPFHGKE